MLLKYFLILVLFSTLASCAPFIGAITYLTNITGNNEIAAINLMNNQSRVLTNLGKWVQSPVFNMQLNRIYFASGLEKDVQEQDNTMIHYLDLETNSIHRLTGNSNETYRELYYYPNEEEGVMQYIYNDFGYSRLALVNTDGSGWEPIMPSNLEYNDYLPKYSPTEERIVFYSDRDGYPQVYSYNLFTSEVENLGIPVPAIEGNPYNVIIFSPAFMFIDDVGIYYESLEDNGEVYMSYVDYDGNLEHKFQIEKITVRDEKVLKYTQCDIGKSMGEKMVCAMATESGSDLVIINVETGEFITKVTNFSGPFVHSQPSWRN